MLTFCKGFIFFCFFIGNDFLPTLFGLDIAVASLDRIIQYYKECLPLLTDYITHNGTIHWDRAAPFLRKLAAHEETKNQLTNDDKINYYKSKLSINTASILFASNLSALEIDSTLKH